MAQVNYRFLRDYSYLLGRIEKVTIYQTSDGKRFEDVELAKAHQNDLLQAEYNRRKALGHFCEDCDGRGLKDGKSCWTCTGNGIDPMQKYTFGSKS